MNCPKCKNPINDYSQECEWCGEVFINENLKNELVINAEATFMGSGSISSLPKFILFRLIEGQLNISDKISFVFENDVEKNGVVDKIRISKNNSSFFHCEQTEVFVNSLNASDIDVYLFISNDNISAEEETDFNFMSIKKIRIIK